MVLGPLVERGVQLQIESVTTGNDVEPPTHTGGSQRRTATYRSARRGSGTVLQRRLGVTSPTTQTLAGPGRSTLPGPLRGT